MASIKFGSHLKELRFLLCQSSKSSQGVRDFIEKEYVPLKLNNPKFPMLVRECSAIEPRLYARYEFGKETSVSLAGLNADQVRQQVNQLGTSKP